MAHNVEAFPTHLEHSLGGLTKLEYAAIHILAAHVGNKGLVSPQHDAVMKLRAEDAVAQARILLSVLP